MPTTNLNQRVRRIATLNDGDIASLSGDGIETEDDLRYLEFQYFPAAMSIVKRRKLGIISDYLGSGRQLDGMITMDRVQELSRTPLQANVNIAGGGAPAAPDPSRGAPKVYTDPLPKFSGDPIDYEEWERKAGSIIKQSVYKPFIGRAANPGDAVEEARCMELYNMLLSCVGDGHALNTVEKAKDDNNDVECGYKAWKALNEWYLDDTQKETMISHYEGKLEGIALDPDTTATEFINQFELYVRKLTNLGETWPDEKMVREFKVRVTDPDYELECRVHTTTFEDLVSTTRKREQDLERKASRDSKNNKRTRRFTRADDKNDDADDEGERGGANKKKSYSGGEKTPYIPFVPTFLYKSLDSSARQNVTKWRKMVNQGDSMGKSDLVLPRKRDEDSESDSDRKPPKKDSNRKKGREKKTRRMTKQRRVGSNNDTVEIKLASSDEDYRAGDIVKSRKRVVTFGDDSKIPVKPGRSIEDDIGASRTRMLKRSTSAGLSGGRKRHEPYAVIDPGAEQDLVGGDGWQIMHFSDESEPLCGALSGMGIRVLPKVDAVTAVEDLNGKVLLLGMGGAAYDRRATQYESLWNSHHMRSHGTIVDDISRKVGGTQCIKVNIGGNKRATIPLNFVNGDIMTIGLRKPTEEELTTLSVVWILPPMGNISTQSLRRNRGVLQSFQLRVPDQNEEVPEEETRVTTPNVEPTVEKGKRSTKEWKELLAFPSDEVVEKTLEATTQLQVEPVEAERREIPRQHRKKRLQMLHPRRLQGRTDADTVFSTVKSIRGYFCVQFFCHVKSDFLFIRCMQRESHSHGAYQDYIREVGASETIVTDNSKTQTGKKWETTSRNVMTKQRKFVPYNQNESKVERRIQDAKHKTTMLLQRSGAPLVFWCYALIFVVDCLNHIAKKMLNWKTSSEVLNGDTADISPFRFKFWQPVKFYDTAGFPQSRWVMARFLGIAWDTGDQFTFRVWSEPDGDWTKGSEFTRNVVRTRNEDEMPKTSEEPDTSQFKFQRKTRTKKRKRGKNDVFELRDIPELEEATNGESNGGLNVEQDVSLDVHPRVLDEDNEPVEAGGNRETTDNTTTTQNKNISSTAEPRPESGVTSEEEESTVQEEPIEMTREVNDHFQTPDEATGIGGSNVMEIKSHDWKFGHLHFKVLWSSGDTSWEPLKDMREDYPKLTARYIVMNKVSRSKRGGDRVLQWAKKVERDIDRAVRRIVRLYDFYLDENDDVKYTRRVQKAKSKKKKFSTAPVYKYGIQVPRNVLQARAIDKANGNTYWQDAMDKEVKALLDLECFEFHPAGHESNLDDTWQRTTLHMVFDVKQDLTRKGRMVAGGHLVEMMDIPVYSSTVKSISIQLLNVISHKAGLEQLCGDIGNAFPNAYTNEKVYIRKAGPEFGKYEGCCIIIQKALYGLCSSSERFRSHLADTLRSFGFSQSRFDNDVWMRLDETGKMYEYICTHVDDFMICSRKPERVMKQIESVYLVKESSKGPPGYYLGNDYKKDKKGRWCVGCKTYLTEAVRRIEDIFGSLPKKDTPMVDGDHPEEDASETLNDEGHQRYQMLIGMLNWICCIGRLDVAFAAASLSRFTSCPRKGHLDRLLRVFGYLKKYRNRRIVVDSRDPIVKGGQDALDKDFTKIFENFYPDAAEEVDAKLPIPMIDEIEVTAFVDSDHAHDKVTRRSITGLLIVVGRTPVFFLSKRQGAIETSTYGAEFCAMRTAVEEVQAVRYMLRCLGVKVNVASLICGDNMGVIQNCTISDSLLKKKHVAIAYHKTRESAAAGMVHPIKIKSEHNFADILTKAVTGKTFWALFGGLTRG